MGFPWQLERGVGVNTWLGFSGDPAQLYVGVWPQKRQHTRGRTEEGEKHTTRQTSNAAAQTKTHGLRRKNGPRIEAKGQKKTPRIKQNNKIRWHQSDQRQQNTKRQQSGETQNNRPKPRKQRTEKQWCACACLPVS